MYLGRYTLGDWVTLKVITRNTSDVPTAPSAAPTVRFYTGSGTTVESTSMPPYEKNIKTGLFILEHFLGSAFAVGQYVALVEETVSSSALKQLYFFEVVASGNNNGAYLNIHYYKAPQSPYIVGLPEDGTLENRKNPRA